MRDIKVKGNIAFNVFRITASIMYSIVIFTYASRVISVEDIGRVSFVKNITSYFILLATLGVNYYAIREASRIKNDRKNLSKLFFEVFFINMVSTMISFIVMLVCIFYMKEFENYRFLLLLNASSIILGGLSSEWIISVMEEYRFISIRSMLIQLLCIIGMILLIRQKSDYWKYAILLVVSGYGGVVFNYVYIIKNKLIKWVHPSEWNWKQHMKPIFILFFMYLSIELYTVLDTTMLGYMKGDRSVGIYSASIKIPRLINSLIAATGVVLIPRLSYYYENNRKKFNRLVNEAMKIVFFLSIPCGIFLFMLSEGIISLLCGNQYGDAFITTRILSFLTLIIPITVLFNNQIFIPMREEIYVLCSTLLGAIVNICLNLLLIPIFAENGAAFASVFAEFSVMCVCLFNVKRKLGEISIARLYANQLMKSMIVLLIVLLFCFFINNPIMRLFLSIIVCIPVYLLICKKDIKRFLYEIEI